MIVDIFQQILSSGYPYKINEIENWLNDNPRTTLLATRILNIAHYQKAKFDAKNPLKIAKDDCNCGGSN